MTIPTEIAAITKQYADHGWKLRRALLSADSFAKFGSDLALTHPEMEVIETLNEAMWFSRRSLPDREAWELRRLSGSPFALVAVLEDSFSEEQREDILREAERRMFDGSHPEPTSH